MRCIAYQLLDVFRDAKISWLKSKFQLLSFFSGARTPTPQNRLSPMPSDMQMAMSPQQHHHMHQQQQYHHLQQHAVQQHTMQSYHNQTDYDHTSGPMQKRIRVANEIGASWNGWKIRHACGGEGGRVWLPLGG